MADPFEMQLEEEEFGDNWPSSYLTNAILDAKYEKVAIFDVIEQQVHLTTEQKNDLRALLNKYTKLFDGTLGVYPHKQF